MQLTKDELDALADQHRVPGHATMIDHQAFAAAVIAAHERKVLEDVEPFVFEEYPYNSHAMGCGLEDRDITDRYEAMAYGWERAMERAAEAIPDDLYPAATVAALKSRADALQARVDAVERYPLGIDAPSSATVNLVVRFARALSAKLAAAEAKYGYSDGWMSPDWMDECRAKLLEHIAKGDPRDVAAYCAFLWHHGESTVS